jgi:protein-S-isoprenylcysteine O-methyltransferase Ste14
MREHFESTGNWLFRRRSYLPIVCLAVIIVSLRHFTFPYGSHRLDQIWEIFCLTISFFGFAIRVLTVGHVPKGTSGRNTRKQKAYVLNTTGMYSLVRHPLYLGNFVVWLGISLFARIWWLTLILLLSYWLYYERIIFAEEEFLKRQFEREFTDWAEQTPAFLPRFSSWKKPVLPFSIRMVVKREHPTILLIIGLFFIIEQAASLITTGSLEVDLMWIVLLGIGFAQYLLVSILKKYTRLLQEPQNKCELIV